MLSLRSVHTTIDTLVYAHNIDPVRVFLTNFTVSRADLENHVVSWTDLFVRNRETIVKIPRETTLRVYYMRQGIFGLLIASLTSLCKYDEYKNVLFTYNSYFVMMVDENDFIYS